MNKLLTILCVVCYFAVISSCNKTKPEEAVEFEYNITMGDNYDNPTWYSLVDSVSYIPLKTDEKTIMDKVKQFVVKNDLIYVLANGVYCFDMDGNCKFKVTNRGRARNEFIEATTLSVSNGNMYLYDKMKGKVIVYNANTGEFIGNQDIPIGGLEVWCIGDNFIFENGNPEGRKNCKFKVFTKKRIDRERASYFYEDEHSRSIGGTISWSNESVLYSSFLRNIAWKIDGIECIPYIKVIVPDEKQISDKNIKAMTTDRSISPDDYNSPNAIYGLSYLAECDDFITGQLIEKDKPFYFIYDKKTGNSRFFRTLSDNEPWQKYPVGEGTTGDADCIYALMPSEYVMLYKDLLGSIGKEPKESMFSKAYSVMNSMKIDDNPFIARFWLKRL